MKMAVIADIHGNLPALEAILKFIKKDGCDEIYHVGDAIAIGPYPKETLQCMFDAGVRMVKGNHEEYFAYGLPRPQPAWMSDGEVLHQQWVHAQLDADLKARVAALPYTITQKIESSEILFVHAPIVESNSLYWDFKDVRDINRTDLDQLFSSIREDIVFYGHCHFFSDITGNKRYINPGSAGCHKTAEARFTVFRSEKTHCTVSHHHLPYDKASVLKELDARQVPEKDFIKKVFF